MNWSTSIFSFPLLYSFPPLTPSVCNSTLLDKEEVPNPFCADLESDKWPLCYLSSRLFSRLIGRFMMCERPLIKSLSLKHIIAIWHFPNDLQLIFTATHSNFFETSTGATWSLSTHHVYLRSTRQLNLVKNSVVGYWEHAIWRS